MVCAEIAPWAKTGGLGDAVAGLSDALCASGHDVRVLLPRYSHLAVPRGRRHTVDGLGGPFRLGEIEPEPTPPKAQAWQARGAAARCAAAASPAHLPPRARRAHRGRRLHRRRARCGPVPAPLRRRRCLERGGRLAPRRAALSRLAHGAGTRAAAARAAQLHPERAHAAQRRLPGRIRRRDSRGAGLRHARAGAARRRTRGRRHQFSACGAAGSQPRHDSEPDVRGGDHTAGVRHGPRGRSQRARPRPARHLERRRLWRLVAGPRPVSGAALRRDGPRAETPHQAAATRAAASSGRKSTLR